MVEPEITTSERRGLSLTFHTNVLWCDCFVVDFTWLRRSSSITASTRNITLCVFWRTGSVCICRHNTYQVAIVRRSLSPSYLRHNSSSRWHDVSLLTSRTSCICYSKTNELLKQNTLDILIFFFFWFIHSFLYLGDVWLCEVTLWLAYWVLLSDCLAVITARNSHICSRCASNISLFTRHQASLPFKKCRP